MNTNSASSSTSLLGLASNTMDRPLRERCLELVVRHAGQLEVRSDEVVSIASQFVEFVLNGVPGETVYPRFDAIQTLKARLMAADLEISKLHGVGGAASDERDRAMATALMWQKERREVLEALDLLSGPVPLEGLS